MAVAAGGGLAWPGCHLSLPFQVTLFKVPCRRGGGMSSIPVFWRWWLFSLLCSTWGLLSCGGRRLCAVSRSSPSCVSSLVLPFAFALLFMRGGYWIEQSCVKQFPFLPGAGHGGLPWLWEAGASAWGTRPCWSVLQEGSRVPSCYLPSAILPILKIITRVAERQFCMVFFSFKFYF